MFFFSFSIICDSIFWVKDQFIYNKFPFNKIAIRNHGWMYSQLCVCVCFFSVKWSVTFNTGSALLFFVLSFPVNWLNKKWWRQKNRSKKQRLFDICHHWFLGDIICVWVRYYLCLLLLNWTYRFQYINAYFVCFDWKYTRKCDISCFSCVFYVNTFSIFEYYQNWQLHLNVCPFSLY